MPRKNKDNFYICNIYVDVVYNIDLTVVRFIFKPKKEKYMQIHLSCLHTNIHVCTSICDFND